MQKEHVVCTIIAPNYLSQALTLGKSLVENMPSASFRILILQDSNDNSVIDEILRSQDYLAGEIADHSTLSLQKVNWQDFDLLGAVNKYDLLEFATAVKPALLRSLLSDGWDRVSYLDPDIQVYENFSNLLSETHGVSLTPHILQDFPIDGKLPNHQSILWAGIYNLGFISCNRDALDFLDWWATKLENYCTLEVEAGYHVDQRWVDWATTFTAVQVIRDAGLNAAYWNLHERSIQMLADGPKVFHKEIASTLFFFHFSGFNDFQDLWLSRHATRSFPESTIPREFIREYVVQRTKWNFNLAEKGSRIHSFLTGWTLGGRKQGTANLNDLRKTLIQKGRAQLELNSSYFRSDAAMHKSLIGVESFADPSVGWLLAQVLTRKQAQNLTSIEKTSFKKYGYSREQIERGLFFTKIFLDNFPRIKIVGYFAAPTGVGQIARNTASLLKAAGISFTAECVKTPFDSSLLEEDFKKNYAFPKGNEDLALVFVNADMWLIDAVTSGTVDRNRQLVSAVWAWEVDSIPNHFIEVAKNIDQIFALSDFSAKALEKAIGKSVKVLPTYCIDIPDSEGSGYSKEVLRAALPELPPKYILSRFDAKSVIKRKNPEAIISVWQTLNVEFPDYHLVIKSTDLKKMGSHGLLQSILLSPRTILIDKEISHLLNESLMKNASAYISLHRAEGLGLNILEAIFADVPVIFTNYSGLASELDQIGFKVGYELVAIGENAHPYPPKGQWAEPDIDSAILQLRTAMHQVADGSWPAARPARDLWVQSFLKANSVKALSEVNQLIDSIPLIQHRFDRFTVFRSRFLSKNLPKMKLDLFLPAWKKLPIGVRQKLKPILLKVYFKYLRRDVNVMRLK